MDYQDEKLNVLLEKSIRELIESRHQGTEALIKLEEKILSNFFFSKPNDLSNRDLSKHNHNEDYYLELDHSCEGLMALNTSFIDIFNVLQSIDQSNDDDHITLCDIGAGYAKFSIISEIYFPRITIISIEPIAQRLSVAKRFTKRSIFIEDIFKQSNDLIFDYVFLYFPVSSALDHILYSLSSMHFKELIAIESHADLYNRLDLESHWLVKDRVIELKTPRHEQYANIYTKKVARKSKEPKLKAFYDKLKHDCFLICRENNDQWIERTNEIEVFFFKEDELFLNTLKSLRTYIVSEQNLSLYSFTNENELTHQVLELIKSRSQTKRLSNNLIRKIFIDGSYENERGQRIIP